MTISQTPLKNNENEPSLAVTPVKTPAKRGTRGKSRVLIANLLLLAASVAVLVAGGWGVLSSLGIVGTGAFPARIGEAAEVPGGSFSVERFAPEHMAPMQMGNFANKGMSMAGPTNMDMAPEGKERFTVDVALAAGEEGDLSFSEEDFQIAGEGMEQVGPYRSELGSGTVPAGSAVSGTMTLQVPKEAENLTLTFDGGQPVALDSDPAENNGGGTSDEDSSHGGGH